MKDISLPHMGNQVLTACGGEIQFEPDTPRAIHKGQWFYFCLLECRNQFNQDPSSSCLAEQILNREE